MALDQLNLIKQERFEELFDDLSQKFYKKLVKCELQIREEDDLFIYTTLMQYSMLNFFLKADLKECEEEIGNFNYVKRKIELLYSTHLMGIEDDLYEN